jgi:hypothetical protein
MPEFNRFKLKSLITWGGLSFIAGTAMLASFIGLVPLPSLRGPYVVTFLAYFMIAGVAYILAVIRLDRDRMPIIIIWGFAILFRLVLLLTLPTLSDDVFRYSWDGHLISQWINPYLLPVNSPALDGYSTALRELVNNNWMASPYLPSAQMLFLFVHQVAPESIKALQITAVLLDLVTAWLVMDILKRVLNSARQVLIYLWNPLVIIEFSHGAHVVDALMICLVMLTFWLLLKAYPDRKTRSWLATASVISLAAATLTKGLPLMLVSVVWRRWAWKRLLLFVVVVLGVIAFFALGAGLGLTGEEDGRGVFGAIRIYMSWWNFNSGIYHWLEVGLSGYQTPGAVPVDIVGERPIQLARVITNVMILLAVLLTAWLSWRLDNPNTRDHITRTLFLLRLATIPISAYILFAHTINPWYMILIIPFLPFLYPKQDEPEWIKRFRWPWIYFSLAVSLSYLTYINPDDLREFYLVRQVEYLPLYLLLIWAIWPSMIHKFRPMPNGDTR